MTKLFSVILIFLLIPFAYINPQVTQEEQQKLNSALKTAVAKRNLERVKELTRQGADTYYTDPQGDNVFNSSLYARDIEITKYLGAAGFDIKATDAYGKTAFDIAAYLGNTEALEYLLPLGADIERRTGHDNLTPLLLAVTNDKTESALFLIQKGANINASDKDAATPLMYAAMKYNPDIAQALLKAGANPNTLDYFGNSALSLATDRAQYGYPKIFETIKILLAYGADPKIKQKSAYLFNKAIERNDARLVELLIKNNADINTLHMGSSPMLLALNAGKQEIIKILKKAGAEPLWNGKTNITAEALKYLLQKTQDKQGTIYGISRNVNNFDVIKMLIQSGMDANYFALDEHSQNKLKTDKLDILKYLVQNGLDKNLLIARHSWIESTKQNDPSAAYLASLNIMPYKGYNHWNKPFSGSAKDVINNLKETDINQKNANGLDAFLYEANNAARPEVMDYLLKAGADINTTDKYGKTPLFKAVEKNDKNLLEYLLSKGAHIDKKDFKGQTPLMAALQNNNTETAKYLISKGANINARSYDGRTPLLFIREPQKNNWQTVKFFIDNGALINAKPYNDGNYSLFKTAVALGDTQMIDYLIKKGININETDHSSRTMVNGAVWSQNPEMMKYLIDIGIDTAIADNHGNTPIMSCMEDETLLKLLLAKGTDINLKNNYGQTPLAVNIQNCSAKAVDNLIKNGADIKGFYCNSNTKECYSYLALAMLRYQEPEEYEGADDDGEQTPAQPPQQHEAAIVKLLIDSGAPLNTNLSSAPSDIRTPLCCALELCSRACLAPEQKKVLQITLDNNLDFTDAADFCKSQDNEPYTPSQIEACKSKSALQKPPCSYSGEY